jgi:hypothetical protein
MFVRTRDAVALLLGEGRSRAEVARTLGVSKSTVNFHARRLGLEVDKRFSRRYDWDAIQRFYDLGHTPSECCARFGCSKASWNDARLRGDLRVRPTATPLEDWLVAGRKRTR